MRAAWAFLLTVMVVAVSLLMGCGTDSGNSVTKKEVDLIIADCSKSFRKSSLRLLPEMVEIAHDSAARRHVLWAGCFAVAPLRALTWNPKVDFSQVDDLPGTDELLDRVNQARAAGLLVRLRRMIEETPAPEEQSGQLEALEVAAEAPHVSRIFFFTDAAIQEPEVPDLSKATREELDKTAGLWASRLEGLKGVHLYLLGAGYGVHNSASVRAARYLFRELADRVEAGSFSWTQELPPAFGTASS
jgi:hypothetical protein